MPRFCPVLEFNADADIGAGPRAAAARLDDYAPGELTADSLRAGVMTCPGREAHLEATWASLAASDFPPGSRFVQRQPAAWSKSFLSVARNALALLRTFLADPSGVALVLLEDDTRVNRHLARNLASWPVFAAGQVHCAMLFVPPKVRAYKWRRHDETTLKAPAAPQPLTYGGCGVLLSRRMVGCLVAEWTHPTQPRCQDARIYHIARRHGVTVWSHSPVLVQHAAGPSHFGTTDLGPNPDYSETWRR